MTGTHTLLLMRHGRTALNAEGRLRGLADPELDPVGIAEAAAAAAAVAGRGIGAVYSSPLRRAVRTAELVADAAGASASADPAFNDRDYGPWTGAVKSEVIAQWGSVDAAPGVEPEQAVLDRAVPALERLAASGPEVAVVVTHDAVIRPLLRRIDPALQPEVETASWAELAFADGAWRVISVDNRA